jgi:hypothetical protein
MPHRIDSAPTRSRDRVRIGSCRPEPRRSGSQARHPVHITGWVEQVDAADTVQHRRVEGKEDPAGNDRRRLRHHELHLDHAARGARSHRGSSPIRPSLHCPRARFTFWQPRGTTRRCITATPGSRFPGTGLDQPMLWTVEYGKGRVFVTALGHDVSAVKTPAFVGTFTRARNGPLRDRSRCRRRPNWRGSLRRNIVSTVSMASCVRRLRSR